MRGEGRSDLPVVLHVRRDIRFGKRDDRIAIRKQGKRLRIRALAILEKIAEILELGESVVVE